MMNDIIEGYPKIFHVGTPFVQNLLSSEVEITEKVDGSFFAFGKINGKLLCRSKGKMQDLDNPDNIFRPAVEYIKQIEDALDEDTIFYCETLRSPRHNSITYDRIPKNNLCLFSVKKPNGLYVSYSGLQIYANSLNIDVVPLLKYGFISDGSTLSDIIHTLLNDNHSYLGESVKMEGVVVRNLSQPLDLFGKIYPFTTAKYVTEKFKELNHKTWNDEKPKNQLESLKQSLATEARWLKAVQRARDEGVLKNDPSDLGYLIKSVQEDLVQEELDYIKDSLYTIFSKDLMKSSIKGLPEWYKELLASNERSLC